MVLVFLLLYKPFHKLNLNPKTHKITFPAVYTSHHEEGNILKENALCAQYTEKGHNPFTGVATVKQSCV
jgi:hypothetical protein